MFTAIFVKRLSTRFCTDYLAIALARCLYSSSAHLQSTQSMWLQGFRRSQNCRMSGKIKKADKAATAQQA